MIVKFLLLCNFFFFFLPEIHGQISIKNPQICHDANDFLNCYNDGTNLLRFGNGNFKEYRSSDSLITYVDKTRTFTFIYKRINPQPSIDTISITLLSHSIQLKIREKIIEIDSLKDLPAIASDFHVHAYLGEEEVRGLTFKVNQKIVKIELWDFRKTWDWEITIKDKSKTFYIEYNSFRKNRVDHILVIDDSLRHSTSFFMTFKSLKKLWNVESVYYDRVEDTAYAYTLPVALDNYYKYEYSKKGRLKRNKTVGELRICDCN